MSNNRNPIIRQGDVLLVPVAKMPEGLKPVPLENGRIVLMHGEVTGHAHAISDHTFGPMTDAGGMERAAVKAKKAIADAARRTKAVLLQAPNGARFLHVMSPVNLTHEEHTAHEIPVGFYELPVQVEHSTERARQVAD